MRLAVHHRLAGARRRRAPGDHARQPARRARPRLPRRLRQERPEPARAPARRGDARCAACTRRAISTCGAVTHLHAHLRARSRPRSCSPTNPVRADVRRSLAGLGRARSLRHAALDLHPHGARNSCRCSPTGRSSGARTARCSSASAAPPLARARALRRGATMSSTTASTSSTGSRAERERRVRRALGFAAGDYVIGLSRRAAAGEESRAAGRRRRARCARAASRRARCFIGDGPERARGRGARARARRRRPRA